MPCRVYTAVPHFIGSRATPFGMPRGVDMELFTDFLVPFGSAIRTSFEKEQSKNFEVRVKSEGCKPEELDVSVVDGHLVVKGKYEERKEENGSFVSRSFIKRFPLPKNVNLNGMSCKFEVNGELIISAPLIVEEKPSNIINIPIHHVKSEVKSDEKSNQAEMEIEANKE